MSTHFAVFVRDKLPAAKPEDVKQPGRVWRLPPVGRGEREPVMGFFNKEDYGNDEVV